MWDWCPPQVETHKSSFIVRRLILSVHPAAVHQVILKGERGRGRSGEMAVDDITLRKGSCTEEHNLRRLWLTEPRTAEREEGKSSQREVTLSWQPLTLSGLSLIPPPLLLPRRAPPSHPADNISKIVGLQNIGFPFLRRPWIKRLNRMSWADPGSTPPSSPLSLHHLVTLKPACTYLPWKCPPPNTALAAFQPHRWEAHILFISSRGGRGASPPSWVCFFTLISSFNHKPLLLICSLLKHVATGAFCDCFDQQNIRDISLRVRDSKKKKERNCICHIFFSIQTTSNLM